MTHIFSFSQFLVLSTFLVLHTAARSQENEPTIKNLYTFSLVNGITRSSSELVTGTQRPGNALAISHGFNFHYTRILHPSFDLSAGAGFGMFPIDFKPAENEEYNIDESFFGGYFGRITYKGFTRVELIASYRKQLSDQFSLRLQAGGGIVHYGGFSLGASGYLGFDTTENQVQIYDLDVNFNNQAKPFATVGFELSKTLKNKDLLGLRISYDHSFRDAFNGTYSLYNGSSTGNYFNKGHYLNIHLGYTMTKTKRLQAIQAAQQETGLDPKAAKKLARKNMRYIDPQSMFLNISGGIGIGGTRVIQDPNDVLQKYGYPSFLPRISFEKGIGKQLYWEAGVHSQLFWNVQRFSFAPYSSSGSSAFYAFQFSGGGIYRWILANNYNVINVHAGLTLGFHTQRNYNGNYGTGGGSVIGVFDNNSVNFNYTYTSKIHSNVLASVYLGLSKDFRVVNNFYFTINYRQQFGLIKAVESTYAYSGQNIPSTTDARTKINGASKDFQIGFKIKFNGK